MTELLGPRPVTAPELLAQMEAERAGAPFLAYRDEAGEQRHLRFGHTVMLFRNPGPEAPATVASIGAVTASTLTEAQRPPTSRSPTSCT